LIGLDGSRVNSFLRAVDPRELSIADVSYDLPLERIAQQPLAERDASGLLRWDGGTISDHTFRDLPELLPTGTLLILNDTRVVNARLVFHRSSGARIEVLCLEPAGGGPMEEAFKATRSVVWNAFIGNAKRWRGEEELLGAFSVEDGGAQGLLRARRVGEEAVQLVWEPADLPFAEVLRRVGHVPLPPYLKRPDEVSDKERYNTVFARQDGSVAAPTASLHFTDEVLAGLAAKGIDRASLTLHVGAGTFLPVKAERMADHSMHAEQVRVPLASVERYLEHVGKGPVVAVGTTALRTLESVYWHGVHLLEGTAGEELAIEQWEPYKRDGMALPSPHQALTAVAEQLRSTGSDHLTGTTRLLIAPGYRGWTVDGLITNFHQPQSTLLLLVAAFVGSGWRMIYEHALRHDYRFLSYGDASLLWRIP